MIEDQFHGRHRFIAQLDIWAALVERCMFISGDVSTPIQYFNPLSSIVHVYIALYSTCMTMYDKL